MEEGWGRIGRLAEGWGAGGGFEKGRMSIIGGFEDDYIRVEGVLEEGWRMIGRGLGGLEEGWSRVEGGLVGWKKI